MFLRWSNTTALVRILFYIRASGISKMASCNRRWIYTTNLSQTLTWISQLTKLAAKNISTSVGIALLSCIQAEIYVIPQPLPATELHL